MSDYESNYGERDYLNYADSFAYRYELEADEVEHQRVQAEDRLHRDDPLCSRAALAAPTKEEA